MKETPNIPGYTYGTAAAASSSVTLADFELMQKSVLFGDEDVKYLRLSHEVLKDQVEAILDVWYGFVGSTPHASANGSSTRPARSTTRRGSITSTRSASVTTV